VQLRGRFFHKSYYFAKGNINGETWRLLKRVFSTAVLFLLLTNMFVLASKIQPARAEYGIISINADGSIDPPEAPISTVDNGTYILTGNITSVGNGIAVYRSNIVIDGSGYTLMGPRGGYISDGMELSGISNVTIKNTRIVDYSNGIKFFFSCQHITIQGNNITTYGGGVGIWVSDSWSNNIIGNTVTDDAPSQLHAGQGIQLDHSDNNSIIENSLTGSNVGVDLSGSAYNIIRRNNISDNYQGILIFRSSLNSISGNDIMANEAGIFLYYAVDNSVYGNNFINNSEHITDYIDSQNSLDNGYPSGGNYWSDYAGVDVYSGPYQNETGSDGLGDAPYVIDANNTDNYPLMKPYSLPHAIAGDINDDRIVDIYDAILLANAYNAKPTSPNWNPNADINGDNIVDIFDAILLANNYGKRW
jgi:parallel beta-helix repeat protein